MFPEFRDLISKLKQEDAHFARLFDEHNELDDKIAGLENDPVTSATADAEVAVLKQKKLALKDELYGILKAAAGGGIHVHALRGVERAFFFGAELAP